MFIQKVLSATPHILALLISAIFIDSLSYKFTNHPNTENIFTILNTWAGDFGFSGLFAHGGLFSAYVIGSAELFASLLLIIGIYKTTRFLQAWGALLALCIMTGAVFFHLCTPLGTDPNDDGGGLFIAAMLVWFSSMVLVYIRRSYLAFVFRRAAISIPPHIT